MMMSLRKSSSPISRPLRAPAPKFETFLAQFSNVLSCVTPRSSVMASYSVRPGDLRLLLSSPPSRCRTTSVVRLRALTLLTPATYRPSHFTRNLKFLYGSRRAALTVNSATESSSDLRGGAELLDVDQHELRRLERCETDEDVHDSPVDVVLRVVLRVALDEVRLLGSTALEHALPPQGVHERTHVEPDGGPQRLVVGLEDHPLGAPVEALLDEQRRAAHRHVLPLAGQAVVTLAGPGAPDDGAEPGEGAQAVDAQGIEPAVLQVGHLDHEFLDAAETSLGPGWSLGHVALAVRPGPDAGHRAARREFLQPAESIGQTDPREVDRGILRLGGPGPGGDGVLLRDRDFHGGPLPRRVDQQHGAPVRAQLCGRSHEGCGELPLAFDRWDAEDREDVGVQQCVDSALARGAACDLRLQHGSAVRPLLGRHRLRVAPRVHARLQRPYVQRRACPDADETRVRENSVEAVR